METTITPDRAPTTDAEYETAVDHLLREMERMTVPMAEKQRHTEKLQVETREMLARLQETLARLEAA